MTKPKPPIIIYDPTADADINDGLRFWLDLPGRAGGPVAAKRWLDLLYQNVANEAQRVAGGGFHRAIVEIDGEWAHAGREPARQLPNGGRLAVGVLLRSAGNRRYSRRAVHRARAARKGEGEPDAVNSDETGIPSDGERIGGQKVEETATEGAADYSLGNIGDGPQSGPEAAQSGDEEEANDAGSGDGGGFALLRSTELAPTLSLRGLHGELERCGVVIGYSILSELILSGDVAALLHAGGGSRNRRTFPTEAADVLAGFIPLWQEAGAQKKRAPELLRRFLSAASAAVSSDSSALRRSGEPAREGESGGGVAGSTIRPASARWPRL